MNPTRLLVEIAIILLLFLLNAVLALAEIAIVTARRPRLQSLANDGDERAKAALALSENPSDFLSTVQIGITLVGILAGAVSGATLGEQLGLALAKIPFIAPYSEFIGVALVVILVTYFSLLIGELVPKRVALNDPEKFAQIVAQPMVMLSRLSSPLVRLLSASTNFVLRLLRVRILDESPVTEDEIRIMIEQGTQAGLFEEAEHDMLKGVFRLADRRVGTLLTPRTEIVWLDLDDPPEKNRQKVIESGYSRFPVARGNLDEVVGVLKAKRLLAASLEGGQFELEQLLDDPIMVPESLPALKVLEIFENTRQRIALIIDEYGGLRGLVTMNDILGAIVGEMLISSKPEDLEVTQREDGSWLVDGLLPVDELKELLHLNLLPEESAVGYQTVGGMVMAYLGTIPLPSSQFDWQSYRFEVMDMDGLRVDKILITPLKGD